MFPLTTRIGRRGAYLLSKGALYAVYGYGLISEIAHRPPGQGGIYGIVALVMPLKCWGMVWMAVGLLAMFSSFVKQVGRVQLQTVAFAGFMALATLWAVSILATYLAPGPNVGAPWIAAALFVALMASTAVVAGWPDVREPR